MQTGLIGIFNLASLLGALNKDFKDYKSAIFTLRFDF